jgi:hypothetical protein
VAPVEQPTVIDRPLNRGPQMKNKGLSFKLIDKYALDAPPLKKEKKKSIV